jgi:hypothetical protein
LDLPVVLTNGINRLRRTPKRTPRRTQRRTLPAKRRNHRLPAEIKATN